MVDIKDSLAKLKNFFWPREAAKKAQVKKHYKAIGLFVSSTALLMRYGRFIADQIYNQAMLDDAIRAGLN